jgi:hypothetical protein
LKRYEPMTVRRVKTDHGSHIEPPFDSSWSHLEQLRWKAGGLLTDHGIAVYVVPVGRRRFSLGGQTPQGCWSISGQSLNACWTYINGMASAARLLGGER